MLQKQIRSQKGKCDDMAEYQDSSNRLGKALKLLRETNGYAQADVATAIDVKQPTYSQYETGKRRPSAPVLYRIAEFYGILLDELMKRYVDLDQDMFFDDIDKQDKGANNGKSPEEADFLVFTSLEKYAGLSPIEKRLLYNLSRLNAEGQDELLEYSEFKRAKRS